MLAVAFALSFSVAGCTDSGSRPQPDHSGDAAVNATAAPLLPHTTDALPPLDAAGFAELLSQLHGTPVVVNVWGSWCGPCHSEAPDLAAAARTHGTEVQFVGIDIADSRGGAQAFIEQYGLPYPSFADESRAISTSLGLIGAPHTLFYDRMGALVDTVSGPITSSALRHEIAKITA